MLEGPLEQVPEATGNWIDTYFPEAKELITYIESRPILQKGLRRARENKESPAKIVGAYLNHIDLFPLDQIASVAQDVREQINHPDFLKYIRGKLGAV